MSAPDIIVVDSDPAELTEVICSPFEPHDPSYAGERFLAIFYREQEESFVILNAAQAARLAELLTGGTQ